MLSEKYQYLNEIRIRFLILFMRGYTYDITVENFSRLFSALNGISTFYAVFLFGYVFFLAIVLCFSFSDGYRSKLVFFVNCIEWRKKV